MTKNTWHVLAFLAGCVCCGSCWPEVSMGATVPANFVDEQISSGWNEVIGVAFDANQRMYAWERPGRVWTIHDGVRSAQPLIDISDECGNWRDFGLLGLALHPDFNNTGYIYLYYIVDHHHLANAGTPSYDPQVNDYFRATIGRITRYTVDVNSADANGTLTAVVPGSRQILLGESISTGIPVLHLSHSVGQLVFATDGTLLASAGDGASFNAVDNGGDVGATYTSQALAEGIIQPKENVGAWRSQLIDSHSGKILRLDPLTGNGVPSNPFFDSTAPRAARSRVWALGLRNPFRITLRPGTGSHDQADADPGVLAVGDVGWNEYEALHMVTGPAQNCGWPMYEGLTVHPEYHLSDALNLDAPNPLFGTGDCTRPFLYFRELLIADTLDPNPSFPITCGTLPGDVTATVPHFVHTPPVIDWQHGADVARVPTYNGLNAAVETLGSPASPVLGSPFAGECAVAGCWYDQSSFPASYHNSLFYADFDGGWIRNFTIDANSQLTEVRPFLSNGGPMVFVTTDPRDGSLIYISWPNQLRRVRHVPSGEAPPTAVATQDLQYGPTPLMVQFTGSASTDPEGLPLLYSWDFGDGNTSTAADPVHVFQAPAGIPTRFDVTLTVTDAAGETSSQTLLVSAENTPPQLSIISPADGTLYPMTNDSIYNVLFDVTDAEHSAGELTCVQQTSLYHNSHSHPEPIEISCASNQVQISPVGCDGETYSYGVRVTVADAHGLSTTQEVFLHPDCASLPVGPPVPTGVTASQTDAQQVGVNWNDSPDTDLLHYNVYRSDISGFTPTLSDHIATVESSAYLDTDLAYDSDFYYVITAVNTAGDESPASDEAPATTDPDLTPPTVASTTTVSATEITVRFDEDVDSTTAGDSSNYSIPGLVLISATALDARTVRLTTSTQTSTSAYTLNIAGVLDLATPGNPANTSTRCVSGAAFAAHWLFDEGAGNVASDSTGNGRTGTLSSPDWDASAPPRTGSQGSLLFSGAPQGDAVNVPSFDIAGSAVTFSAWFRPASFTVGDGRIFSRAVGVNQIDHYWMLSTVSVGTVRHLRVRLRAGGVTTLLVGNGVLSQDTWTHAAVRYDGTTLTLFQDGVAVGTAPMTGTLSNGNVPFAIGNQSIGAGQRAFHGNIDRVAIFGRALTAAEIAVLAASAPAATSDTITCGFGASVEVAILDNDTSAGNAIDPASLSIDIEPLHGSLSISPAGVVTYLHDGANLYADDFTYHVRDVTGRQSVTTRVSVQIDPTTCAPVTAIVAQPQDTIACVGGDVSLDVIASGLEPLSYQWRRNGVVIDGATDAVLWLLAVDAADFASYDCVVSNLCGEATSDAAILSQGLVPPTVNISSDITACLGDHFDISLTVSGTGPFTYQWFKDGTLVPGATLDHLHIHGMSNADVGTYYATASNQCGVGTSPPTSLTLGTAAPDVTGITGDVTACPGADVLIVVATGGGGAFTYEWFKDGVLVPGATLDHLDLNAVTAADVGVYHAAVSNGCGTTISATTSLTLGSAAPNVTNITEDLAFCPGDNLLLSVFTAGAGPFTYEWFKDGVLITGATNDSVQLNPASNGDVGSYHAAVSNGCGTTISPTTSLTLGTAPTVTGISRAATACPGDDVMISVSASGAGTLTYQWFRGGTLIVGAAKDHLHLDSVSAADVGTYTARVSNACGTTTSPATSLTLSTAPTVSGITGNTIGCPGEDIVLSVTATGTGPLTYAWFKDGSLVTGAATDSLSIIGLSAADAGIYHATVTNDCGTASSGTVTVSLGFAPLVGTSPVDVTACAGDDVAFALTAIGAGPLSYQWFKDGTLIPGATTDSLQITAVSAGDSGAYHATVGNACGTTTSASALLTLEAAPTVTGITGNTTACLGATVSLSVAATGTAPLTYQWFKDGAPLNGATTSLLQLNSVTANDAGSYTCVVTNPCGSRASDPASVVLPPLVVTGEPQDVATCLSGTATFLVQAQGQGTLSYQWSFNGTPIAGAVTSQYQIVGVQAADLGAYSCAIGDFCTTTVSAAATLSVGAATMVTLDPVDVTTCPGTVATFTGNGTGVAPVTFQWLFNGAPIAGATNNTLVVAPVMASDLGSYALEVTGLCGAPVVSAAAALALPPVCDTDPTLIAHWELDEGAGTTAADSANDNTGNQRGGLGWDGPSQDGSPFYGVFDGVNDAIDISGNLDVVGNQVTLACWFRADDFGVKDGRLISKASGTAGNAHLWMLSTIGVPNAAPNDFFLRFRLKTGSLAAPTTTLIASSGALTPGVWTHAAAVYDGATMTLYKDGVAVGSVPQTGTVAASSGLGVSIGNQPANAGPRPFDGCIDDVRIYERALTAQEVQGLAMSVLPPITGADSYTFDEDEAAVVAAAQGVLVNDSAPSRGLLTAQLVSPPANAALFQLLPDGGFLFTPAADFNGTDSFTYQAMDAQGLLSASQVVSITVLPLPDAPVAVADVATTDEDVPTTLDVTSNDFDVDDNPITPVIETQPSSGFAAVVAGGIEYTPNLEFSGLDSFTYHVTDGVLASAPTQVTITVVAMQDRPVAVADNYMMTENSTFTLAAPGILVNDTDADGDPLTAIVQVPLPGATVGSDGSISYTPPLNFDGLVTFTYVASDGISSDSDPVTVSILVADVALLPPTAVADQFTTPEDTLFSANVLSNDTDPQGLQITAILVSDVSNGALSLLPDGMFSYTPSLNFNGVDVFTYRAENSASLSSPAVTVTLTVDPINDPPLAVGDTYQTDEDVPLVVAAPGVLAGDSDVDLDPLSVSLFSPTANGMVALNADGSFTYTPDGNFHGTDSFQYTLSDGIAPGIQATVDITVNPVIDAPVANPDAYTIAEDTALVVAAPGVGANDLDVDGAGFSAAVASNPINGAVVLNADGSFVYTPNLDFSGPDSFTYTAANGATSLPATVMIDVTPVLDPPVAVADSLSVARGTTFTQLDSALGLLANDLNAEGGVGSLTASLDSPPSAGLATVNADGTFSYMHFGDPGNADSFTYLATGPGGTSVGTVSVSIQDADPGLVAHWEFDEGAGNSAADSAGTRNGTLQAGAGWDGPSIDASSNYVLLDGSNDYVNIPSTLNLAGNAVTITCWFKADDFGVVDGRLLSKASGAGGNTHYLMLSTMQLPYNTPGGLFHLRFRVKTGGASNPTTTLVGTGNTLTAGQWIHAAAVYDGATMKLYQDGVEVGSMPLTGNLAVNPSIPTAIGNQPPGAGARPFDGCIDDVRVYDRALSVTEVMELATLLAAPVAVPDSYEMDEDDVLVVPAIAGVLLNDIEPNGDPMFATLDTPPASGSVTLLPTGGFTYTPNADFFGTDSFLYRATNNLADSAPTAVSIVVANVPDAPVAVADTATGDQDMELTVPAPGVLANDTDADGDSLTATLVADATNGSVTLNPDGSYTYQPDLGFSGVDSFAYTANDSDGPSAPATVTITVAGLPDPATANEDTYTAVEDVPLSGTSVLTNDVDGNVPALPLTAQLESDVSNGLLVLAADGTFTYTPDLNFNGADQFTYRAFNGVALSNVATVTIDVTAVPDLPVANADSSMTNEAETLNVAAPGVLANDTDAEGDSLTATLVADATNGSVTLNPDGSYTYQPDLGFSGVDSFAYVANDSDGPSAPATVTITVAGLPDPATANDDTYTAVEDVPLSGTSVLTNDVDGNAPALPLTAQLASDVSNGLLVLAADGTFTYTPDLNFNGADQFTYRALNGVAPSNVATVTIDVTAVPDLPVAIADSYMTNEAQTLNVTAPGVLTNDTDEDLDSLTAALQSTTANGVLALNPDGSFSYTPTGSFAGTDQFTYVANDGQGNSAPATVTIQVIDAINPPGVVADSYSVDEDQTLTELVGVLFNDVDPQGLPLTVVVDDDVDNGSLTLNANGTFVYTPNPNFNGTDSFTYLASNGTLSSVATATIDVVSVPDAPVANSDSYTVDGGSTLTVSDPALGLLGNDTDVDGDTLTVQVATPPAEGTLTLNGDGTFTYEHNGAGNPSETFTYEVLGGGIPAFGTVTIQVLSLSQGLFAHWRFDENGGLTAVDSVGSNNGTIQGAVHSTQTNDGSVSKLSLDGNDRVNLGTMDVPAGNELSIAFWMRANAFAPVDVRFISKATSTAHSGHWWMVSSIRAPFSNLGAPIYPRFRLKTGSTTTTLVGNAPAGVLSTGVWTHIAAVYDGSTMRLFKDGVQVGSVAKTGIVATNSAVAATIGNQPAGSGEKGFDGCLDDMRIYSRALSASEVAQLAQGTE